VRCHEVCVMQRINESVFEWRGRRADMSLFHPSLEHSCILEWGEGPVTTGV
jgi:hypothetical protein